jgi:hypothetical protein
VSLEGQWGVLGEGGGLLLTGIQGLRLPGATCDGDTTGFLSGAHSQQRRGSRLWTGVWLDDAILGQLVQLQVVEGLPWADDSDICKRGTVREDPMTQGPSHLLSSYFPQSK